MEEAETLTANERAWLRFLREVSKDADPSPINHPLQVLKQCVLLVRMVEQRFSFPNRFFQHFRKHTLGVWIINQFLLNGFAYPGFDQISFRARLLIGPFIGVMLCWATATRDARVRSVSVQ